MATWGGSAGVVGRDEADRLAALGHDRTWEPGDLVMRQGGPADGVVVVRQGHLKVLTTTPEGRSLLLALRGPGDLVGELACLDGGRRSADVVALTPVTGRWVDRRALWRHLEGDAGTMRSLVRLLATRLREADRSRLEQATEPTQRLLARRLLELAASHGRPTPVGFTIDMPVTQEELASWIGISRERLGDAFRRLREDGLVATGRRRVDVVDVDALRERALG